MSEAKLGYALRNVLTRQWVNARHWGTELVLDLRNASVFPTMEEALACLNELGTDEEDGSIKRTDVARGWYEIVAVVYKVGEE